MTTETRHTTITCGEARITLLTDGTSYWDGGGSFGLVPRAKWMKVLPPDENNLVPQELRCVLIEADNKRILVDCGVGTKPDGLVAQQYVVKRPRGTLMDDLARHGFGMADIDIVILTHLHGDHSGWATVLGSRGAGVQMSTEERTSAPSHTSSPALRPTFPNARYYVQRIEYDDATHTNERTRNTYFAENFVPLHDHGVLTLLDGDAHITLSVRVAHTPGHTAGHQSVIVEPLNVDKVEEEDREGELSSMSPPSSRSSPVFLIGDMAPFMIHFERLPWVTAYDVLPLVTLESKRTWQRWAFEHDAILISCHDTHVPVGKLARNDKGLYSVLPFKS